MQGVWFGLSAVMSQWQGTSLKWDNELLSVCQCGSAASCVISFENNVKSLNLRSLCLEVQGWKDLLLISLKSLKLAVLASWKQLYLCLHTVSVWYCQESLDSLHFKTQWLYAQHCYFPFKGPVDLSWVHGDMNLLSFSDGCKLLSVTFCAHGLFLCPCFQAEQSAVVTLCEGDRKSVV